MRIIAGELRGRRLGKPVPGVRPTSDRVRESLFARLGEIRGARVLDLFAGSGALGIEAVSRGAEQVTFVDVSSRAVAALRKTLASFDVEDRCEVMKHDARGAVRRLGQSGACFDLVLIDPPYDDFADIGPLLEAIVSGGLLAPDAVVVVESAKRHSVAPILGSITGLLLESTRTYGETTMTWLTPDEGATHSGGTDRR